MADPLTSTSSTVKFGALGFKEQERVRAAIEAIDAMPIPTYVIHGSDDPLVPPSASARLEGKGSVTRRVHEGLRHECHHAPQHAEVLAEVAAWLDAQLPGAVARLDAQLPGAVARLAGPAPASV